MKCTCLTFDFAVTLNRKFTLGIHPINVCHSPRNIFSTDAEHYQTKRYQRLSYGLWQADYYICRPKPTSLHLCALWLALSRFALSRFAPESFRPPLCESFRTPTMGRFARYLMSRFAHFLNSYFIEDIVKNLQFLFPSTKILLYLFKKW